MASRSTQYRQLKRYEQQRHAAMRQARMFSHLLEDRDAARLFVAIARNSVRHWRELRAVLSAASRIGEGE